MKKLFQILIITMFCLAITALVSAKAIRYTLYLDTAANYDAISGNTTAPGGGVTNMVVAGAGLKRVHGKTTISNLANTDEIWVIQVTNLTISQHAQAQGGDNSGTTFSVRYKESLDSGTSFWNKAQTVDVITGMALSGNTLYQVEFFPAALGGLKWEFITGGTTTFDYAEIEFWTMRKD